MGYTTEFDGTISFNKIVTYEMQTFINRFSHNRHVKRDPKLIPQMDPEWQKHCYRGSLGPGAMYYYPPDKIAVDKIVRKSPWYKTDANNMVQNDFGQIMDISVLKDEPPDGVPGYWCQWIINNDGDLEWDGGEKFYNYVEWLKFLITHFFEPAGYILNGSINFQGEDSDDTGIISVTDNVVSIEYTNGLY